MKSNWVTTTEISQIAECGIQTARQIKDECNQRIIEKGYRVVSTHKTLRKELLSYLGLENEQTEKGNQTETLAGKENG